MANTKTPPTVGEIVAALTKLDQNLPFVVSTHYDNDTSHSADISLSVVPIYHVEGSIWDMDDASSPLPDSIMAAVLTGASS